MTPDREDPDRENTDRPFLERWSRRKREGEASDRADGQPAEQLAAKAEAEAEGEDAEARLQRLESNRAAAEAIDLDSLDSASDLSPFYKEGVPKALKMAAMRAMWRTSPVFANLDGLNDYDQNFADPELIRKFTGTAWKIGRGYLTDDSEPMAEDAAEAAGEAAADEAEPEEAASVETETEAPESPDSDTATGAQARENAKPDRPEPDGPDGPDDEDGDDRPRVPLRARLALDDWQTD
jgi:hypothetical protein